jgi:hypothetical protein
MQGGFISSVTPSGTNDIALPMYDDYQGCRQVQARASPVQLALSSVVDVSERRIVPCPVFFSAYNHSPRTIPTRSLYERVDAGDRDQRYRYNRRHRREAQPQMVRLRNVNLLSFSSHTPFAVSIYNSRCRPWLRVKSFLPGMLPDVSDQSRRFHCKGIWRIGSPSRKLQPHRTPLIIVLEGRTPDTYW